MGKKTDVATALANAGMAGYGIKGSAESNNPSNLAKNGAAGFVEAANQVIRDAEKAHGGDALVGKSPFSKVIGRAGVGLAAWGGVNDGISVYGEVNTGKGINLGNAKISTSLSLTGNVLTFVGGAMLLAGSSAVWVPAILIIGTAAGVGSVVSDIVSPSATLGDWLNLPAQANTTSTTHLYLI